MSDLADLINKHRDGLSNRAIAMKANVSPETVNRMVQRKGTPGLSSVDQVARALGIDVEVARKAAALPPGVREPYTPPREADLLNDRQRRALDELIRSIAATRGAEHEDTSTQGPPADPPPRRSARPTTPTTRAGDAGTQGSYELAARKGMTQRQWELANEPQAEDENQDSGTDDPA